MVNQCGFQKGADVLKKIQSETGASLSFALLIFLVCTVVGSVILTSGTASSGRLSRLRDMDTRYYSVESAANLIQDTLNNRVVQASYEIDEDEEIVGDINVTVDGEEDVFGTMLMDAVRMLIRKEGASTPWHTLTFSGDLTGKALEQLKATAKVKFKANGIINFVVSNTDEDEKYSVMMDVEPDYSQREEKKTEIIKVAGEEREVERTFIYVTVVWKGGEIRLV